jgi:predicted RNA-binding protein YlxR (DUF448 family)
MATAQHRLNPSPPAGEVGGRTPPGGDAASRHSRAGTRTCVACRQEAVKTELIRFVRRPGGGVEVDVTGRAPGRGAYLHRSAGCLEVARKRRALDRALGTPVQPEVWSQLDT